MIFQDATSVVVANHLQVPMHLVPHTLKKTEWRDSVRAGDHVQIKLYRCDWHIAVVRKIVHTAVLEDTFLYVEPAFFGKLVKVPLASLRLRQALPEDHKDFAPLLSSGFAFDAHHAENMSRSNSVNQHFGLLSAYHNSSGAWVLRPPCALPRFVRMVRQDNGVLAMCSTCDLLPEHHSRARVSPQHKTLGVVRVPLQPPNAETTMHPSGVDVFYRHVRNRDMEMACAALFNAVSDIVVTTEEKDWVHLCASLCACSTHDIYTRHSVTYHNVSAAVWQHRHWGYAHYAEEDLDALAVSIERLKRRSTDAVEGQLDELLLRIGVYSMYKSVWSNAREIQYTMESVRPVGCTLERVHVDAENKCFAEFHVYANAMPRTLVHKNSIVQDWFFRELHHTSTILRHFTPDPQPSPAEGRIMAQFIATRHGDGWKTAVSSLSCAVNDCVAERMLLRESEPCLSQRCVMQEAVTDDGDVVPWNLYEGPLCATTRATRTRRGGVLVHLCARQKVNDVADMLLSEMRGEHGSVPADRGSTLIVCSPTVLFEWQRVFARKGIPSHVFWGTGRRGPAALEAMHRGDVLLATQHALSSWEDFTFFEHATTPVWRLIIDEFDTRCHQSASFVDGIISFPVRRLWLLARECTRDVMALALPLMRVRPFARESNWAVDSYSDFKRRPYVYKLLYASYSRSAGNAVQAAHDRMLYRLCKHLFLYRGVRTTPVIMQRQSHAPGSGYTTDHARTLTMLYNSIFVRRASGRRALPSLCKGGYAQTLQMAELAAWGITPPMEHLTRTLGVGAYQTDPAVHMTVVRARATSAGNAAPKCLDKCVRMCESLSADTFVEDFSQAESCPICMEPLGVAASDNELQRAVVVGQCGHALCGDCAHNIHCAAMRSMQSEMGSYGPTAPVNQACCPLCRESWREHPPLICTTTKGMRLTCEQNVVRLASRDLMLENYTETPLVDCLRRVLVDLTSRAPRSNVVVVCRSAVLTNFLHRQFFENSVKVSGNMPANQRGNALIAYNCATHRANTLFITASLMRGLVFENTKHFVFAESVTEIEKQNIVFVIKSSVDHSRGNSFVHTIKIPKLRGEAHSACVSRTQTMIPVVPATRGAYIARIRALFDAHETPAVHSIVV